MLYKRIEQEIIAKIRSGEWNPGTRIPSERKLCESHKVNRKTVRSAIGSLIDKGFLERQNSRGTFVRHGIKFDVLGDLGTGNIGFIICKTQQLRQSIATEPFYFGMLSELQRAAAGNGYHLLFHFIDENDETETADILRLIAKCDGLIVEETTRPEFVAAIESAGVPTVYLTPMIEADRIDSIQINLRAGMCSAVSHLAALGHSRIAMLNGPLAFRSAALRYEGYKDALDRAGLAFDEKLVAGDGWLGDSGHAAMLEVLSRGPDITAVACATDGIACGALSAAIGAGRKVPEDLSIVGFDDSAISRNSVPPLSTVRVNVEELARLSVGRVVEKILRPGAVPLRIEVPLDYVERRSVRALTNVGGKEGVEKELSLRTTVPTSIRSVS